MKFLSLVPKNLRRHVGRTMLTSVGTMVLVFIVTLIWSVLHLIDRATLENSKNLKAVVTERWQMASQMPFSYARVLSDGAARESEDIKPLDSMTWQYFAGTMDPDDKSPANYLFLCALEPVKLATMMDDLEDLKGAAAAELQENIRRMEQQRNAILVGRQRLARLGKRVGDRFTAYGLNYAGINLEFEIVGVLPAGRYDSNMVMHRDYLNNALEDYAQRHNGQSHPLSEKSLNVVWLRVPDQQAFAKIAAQIESSPAFTNPAVKCETLSKGLSSFVSAYRDLLWGLRWLLTPVILATLALIMANSISISVRERRMEFAVLKVLGYGPNQLLIMVLSEAMLVGMVSGLLSAAGVWLVVNQLLGGLKFPLALFPVFHIPASALLWGLTIGMFTALAGSIAPALSAHRVSVASVFSRIS